MQFLALIPLLVIISWLGYKTNSPLLRSNAKFSNLPGFSKIAIDLVTGFSVFFLATHLLAFPLHSFIYACYAVAIAALLWFLIDIKNLQAYIDEINNSETNWLVVFYALALGFIAAYKNYYIGDSAKFHFTLIGSLANNHVYPPVAPFDWAQDLSGYHFGIIATSALFKIICGLDAFQASAIQLGVQVSLFASLAYTLFNFISKSQTWAMIFTLIFFHFYSILQGNLVIPWLVSRSHTLAFSWTLVTIIVLLCIEKKNFKNYFLVLSPLSFFLYLAFPADWYPLVAGTVACLVIQTILTRDWSKDRLIQVTVTAISLVLGKVLTLMHSFTSLNGVEALVFKPGLRWFAMLRADTQGYEPYITSIQLDKMATIPLWSWYSFKSFLLLFAIATIVFLIDALKNKYEKSILYFAASASMLVPFLYVFEPYPKDTQRFIFYSQIIFLIYILLFIAERMQFQLAKQASWLCLISVLAFGYLVFIKPELYRTYAVPNSQRAMLRELEATHESGDVIASTEFLHISSFYPNIAGFYGIGGHFYSADMITRVAAIHLLNPLLLQELGVDYLLINAKPKVIQNKTKRAVITQKNSIAKRAVERLNDPELFQIIELKSSPSTFLVKFLAQDKKFSEEETALYHHEYAWTVGQRNIFNFVPVKAQDGKFITAQTKAELEPFYRKLQAGTAKRNTVAAVSLSMGVTTSVSR
ncbi:MAG: hypothetical protein OXU45_00685 [Candidatus Melainabacteria bacterium]|nr:hypothetical protein [Candidatus Melainabacteria bacterium]